jgi:hypothetical protein
LADNDTSFGSLLKDFLRGSGIPCPQLFIDAKIHFHLIVDLEHISNDGFRSRIFCWAASGSCKRESDVPPITVGFICYANKTYHLTWKYFQVKFISDNEASYGDNNNRAGMIHQGKVAFKTCFHLVLIPASYVLHLANQAYPTTGPNPTCFHDAFNHWILCETLNAIGNHTVV